MRSSFSNYLRLHMINGCAQILIANTYYNYFIYEDKFTFTKNINAPDTYHECHIEDSAECTVHCTGTFVINKQL